MITAIAHHLPYFWPVVGLVLGAVFGSFLGCMYARILAGVSLRKPPSYCENCGTTLRLLDLLPVFSWLMMRGKCRHCGANIGLSALLWELCFAFYGAGLVWLASPSKWLVLVLALGLVGASVVVVGMSCLLKKKKHKH